MSRKISYKLLMLFLAAMLQVYFFDRLPTYPYVQFSFYMAYVVLLSVNTPTLFILLSSSILGAIADITTGSGGLITITITAAAYVRIKLLQRMLSEDSMKYDFIPSVRTMGATRWFFYTITLVLINAILLVLLESGGLLFVRFTIFIRLVLNVVLTTLIIYIIQLLFDRKPKSSFL